MGAPPPPHAPSTAPSRSTLCTAAAHQQESFIGNIVVVAVGVGVVAVVVAVAVAVLVVVAVVVAAVDVANRSGSQAGLLDRR